MLRHAKDLPSPDGLYNDRIWIIESAKEMQECSKFLPPTDELPTTHEHRIEHFAFELNGQMLNAIRVGVRPKIVARKVNPDAVDEEAVHTEPDSLNSMDDAQLEEEAAKAGVKNYPKNSPKNMRVGAIRKAQLTKRPPPTV